MFSMDLTTPGCGSSAVVALRGELDVADAATVAAGLVAAAVRDQVLIVDLAGLDFIDSSGVPSFGTVETGLPTRHRLVFVPIAEAAVGPAYLKVQHYDMLYHTGSAGERRLACR